MLSRTPEISVVMPVRNAAGTLPAALDSLWSQSHDNFEVIVVDDGSTDGGPGYLRELERRESRLRVITRPHRGIVAALNDGLAEACGSFIARMDADDLCHAERLERQADVLRQRGEVGLISCRVTFGGDPVSAAGYLRHVEFVNGLVAEEDIELLRFRESPFAHPSVMFRRELVARFGGYRDGDFPEDYELWLRWLEAGVRMAKLPEALLSWNDPPGRLSRVHPRYSVDRFYAMKFGYLARWLALRNPHHPFVHIVGAGRITRRRVDALRAAGIVVRAYADVDPRKIGNVLDGVPVIHHDQLPAPGEGFIVTCVGSIGAADYLRNWLEGRGHRRGRDFIEAA